jgi:hypothetical protein
MGLRDLGRSAVEASRELYQMHRAYTSEFEPDPVDSDSPVIALLTSDIQTVAETLDGLTSEEITYDPSTEEFLRKGEVDLPDEPFTQDLPISNNGIMGDYDQHDVLAHLVWEEDPSPIREISHQTGLEPHEVKTYIDNMERAVEIVYGEGYRLPEELTNSLRKFSNGMPEDAHELPTFDDEEELE